LSEVGRQVRPSRVGLEIFWFCGSYDVRCERNYIQRENYFSLYPTDAWGIRREPSGFLLSRMPNPLFNLAVLLMVGIYSESSQYPRGHTTTSPYPITFALSSLLSFGYMNIELFLPIRKSYGTVSFLKCPKLSPSENFTLGIRELQPTWSVEAYLVGFQPNQQSLLLVLIPTWPEEPPGSRGIYRNTDRNGMALKLRLLRLQASITNF